MLGDRYGTTCAAGIVDLCEMVFAGAGLRVARNRPYAGGFIARTYGRPQHGIHALQIEISRHLYMNEVTLEKNEGFNAIRQLIERLTLALIGYDLGAADRPAAPARQGRRIAAPEKKRGRARGGPSQGRKRWRLASA